MIAYSSVVHMRVMALGLFSFCFHRVQNSFVIMVAHGFISPLLFYLIVFLYDFNHSRRIMVLKGLLLVNPLFCGFWFLSCCLNLRVPPFISFHSEVGIIGSLGFSSFIRWLIISLGCFFTGVYCIVMYTSVSHGVSLYSFFNFLPFNSLLVVVCHCFFIIAYPVAFFVFWLISL